MAASIAGARRGSASSRLEDRAEAVVRGRAPAAASASPYFAKTSGKKARTDVAEDDRVGDLHHRGLEVHREQHALGLGARDLLRRGTRAAPRRCMTVASTTSPASTGTDSLQHGGGAVVADELDAQRVVGVDDDGLLGGAEVVGAHVRDVGLRVRRPGAHRVRVRARRSSSPTAGARRSELPSRSTGLTALPLTLS